MKREIIVISTLSFIIIVLFFVNKELSDQLYTSSVNYNNTSSQVRALKLVNQSLRNQLLRLESYTYIEQEAQKQGYIPVQIIDLNK